MGKAFAAMLPEGDPAHEEMTPRLLFMVSEMYDYSTTLLRSWGTFNHEFNHKFASFARARLGCCEGEHCAKGAAPPRSAAGRAMPASLAALALLAALGPGAY